MRQESAERLRRVISVLAMVVTVYYLTWRAAETFNPDAMFFSWMLYSAEVYGAITTFLFYFMVWRPRQREPLPPLEGRTVDILVPTMRESLTVLRKTLVACQDIEYPHRTLVLDDGNRPEVKGLAEELGCVYLARPEHQHAKAGNLNYGLEHSNAEFICVFDADHAPLPEFINRLIGYFKDDRVAFVQTPQEFYNIDSFQHRVDRKKKYIWGEQYLFFSLIQPGKDHWNSAYFVGSCAMLRRKALDEIGGFATGSITEDMLTSLKIHARKWRSVYHNENLAYGIAAETLLPFHTQRQRWGVGNWQVFFKANPLFIKGLTFPQRISYMASMMHPLEGLQKIVFYATPVIALITGVLPMRALDVDYLMHFVPYFLITQFGFNEVARGYGGLIMLEQFSMGKFYTYIKSIFSFFIPKMKKTFKVTPKGEASYSPYRLILPQFLVFGASIGAIGYGVFQLLTEARTDNFVVAVNCFWGLYNASLALAIMQYDYKKLSQRRESFRIPDALPVLYKNGGEAWNLSVADNITERGISMIGVGQLGVGQMLDMEIVLPTATLSMKGRVVQERTVMAGEDNMVSRLGIAFNGVPRKTELLLAKYLKESAVPKLMREYSTRYKTYLEKRFVMKRHLTERAYRTLSYLPVNIKEVENGNTYFGVIKDVSSTGLLMASKAFLPSGTRIKLQVVLGQKTIDMDGTVVRNLQHQNHAFPEYLSGVHLDERFQPEVKRVLDISNTLSTLVLE
jgi:cellulose synthase (UDP-forming)